MHAKIRELLVEHANRAADAIEALAPELVRESLAAFLGAVPAVSPPRSPTPRAGRAAKVTKTSPAKSTAAARGLGRPPMRRDQVVAHAKAGKSPTEIAAALDMKRSSVDQHLYVARRAGQLPAAREPRTKPSKATRAKSSDDDEEAGVETAVAMEHATVQRLAIVERLARPPAVLRSTLAPCSVLAPKPLGQRYTEAELDEARQAIATRKASAPVEATPADTEPVELAPLPFIAALPVPRFTAIVENWNVVEWHSHGEGSGGTC